jgi:hypothetical protein
VPHCRGISRSADSRPGPELIERTTDAPAALIEHVRVDHRGADVAVSEQFLDRADVIASFKKMGRERMTKRWCLTGPALLAAMSPL